MIDTHSHIYGPEYDDDRESVISRARAAGVDSILLPNIDAQSVAPMLALCEAHPDYCHPMLGLHPTELGTCSKDALDEMEKRLQDDSNPYVAIGEVGLDFYWDRSQYEEQLEVFERQVCWARDLHLPLMIHARSAQGELLTIMERHRKEHLTGVFHCFGGTLEEAEQLLSFEGFALGIGGIVTYKKSALPTTLKQVPLSRIVLETDSPYLAPVPHRGKRNESAFVSDVMKKVSLIYEVDETEVDRQTSATVYRIFTRLPKGS